MGKLETLRAELEKAREKLHARGFEYDGKANGYKELMAAKPFEIAYQDVIEKIWPDNAWWEVTHYWDIFDAMMGGFSDEEVIDEICKHVGKDYLDEEVESNVGGAYVEKGHNMREYIEKFGDAYDNGELWDFSKEDFENGAIDVNPYIIYWYMQDLDGEWRYFETNLEPKKECVKEEKKLDEGTSNFGAGPEHFPLLVFYTYDEYLYNLTHAQDYPQEEQFEDEDGKIDWDAFENAKEEFELKYDESNKICVLDEDTQERLENKLYDFNEESKRIAWDADVVDGEQQYGNNLSLEDVKVNIEPGYYSAAYIDVEHEDYLEDLDEDFKAKQFERFTKLFQELKSEFGLTELSAGPMASNGERGYSIVNNESLDESNKKYALVVNGEWYSTYDSYEKAQKAQERFLDAIDNDEDAQKEYGAFANVEIKEVNESLNESMESEVTKWWKDVEDANKEMKWDFKIDNGDYSDVEAMHAAMFDMLDDLKEKGASDLFNRGKKIYNKYAISKYNEELKESCSDKELVDKLVAFGTCADEKEAKERVAKMSKEDKEKMCKSLSAQAKDHLLNDSLNESDEVARVEYCVMDKDNNNIECFDNTDDAIAFAKEHEGIRVLEVQYGPKDENGDEEELGCEEVWSIRESLKEENIEEKKSKKKYKIRYTGDPAKDAAFFNHAMGSDKGDVSVEKSSVSLGEGYVGQDVEDFLDVISDNEAIETLVISNIDADDYTEAFKGKYEDLDSNLLHCEYADFDVGGDILVVNVKTESDDWNDLYYDDLESLLEDYNGDEIRIIDVDTGETLFEGDKEDIDDEVKGLTFWSIDTPKYLCVNAHCGEIEDLEPDFGEDDELKIEYWYDEESRDQGLGDMYFGEIEDEEDGKRIVRKMIDRDGFASAELQRGDTVLFGYDGESTWGELAESLDEASHRGMDYYEYKGCHVRETPSCFVATDEHGTTLGDSKTKAGAEGIIDDHVAKKDEKLSKKQIDKNVKRNLAYLKWQGERESKNRDNEKKEEVMTEDNDVYALHLKVIDANTGKINKIERIFVGSKKECDVKKKQLEDASPEDANHNKNVYKVSKVK